MSRRTAVAYECFVLSAGASPVVLSAGASPGLYAAPLMPIRKDAGPRKLSGEVRKGTWWRSLGVADYSSFAHRVTFE